MRRLLPWLILLAGCSASEPRFGELGAVELAYSDGFRECQSDCDPSEPMAVDARALLQIENVDTVPRVSLRALDPDAIEITETFSRELWIVRALRAGAHTLVFEDVRDQEIDRFVIEARDVATLGLEDEVAPLGEQIVELAAYDEGGASLRGYGFVEASASENVSSRRLSVQEILEGFDRPRSSYERPVNYEAFELVGDGGGGEGTIVFTTESGARLDLTVPVVEVPPTRVSFVRLRGSPDSYAYNVRAELTVEVMGLTEPCCSWSFEPADAEVDLNAETCTEVRALSTASSATATIVCEANGARGELALTITGP